MEIIKQKKDIEQQIIDEAGVVTDEMMQIFEDNAIELKDKVDAYGFTIDKLNNDEEFLKGRKKRINDLQNAIKSNISKIKNRLNYLAKEQGELIGNEYKFKPYISKVAKEIDMSKVESEYATYTFVLTNQQYTDLCYTLDSGEVRLKPDLQEILNNPKISCKVSDLPKDHPAIIYELTETVKG